MINDTLMILAIFAIPILITSSIYIIESIGLMKLAQKMGDKYAWLAWIPGARNYLFGRIAFNKEVGWAFAALGAIYLCLTLPLDLNLMNSTITLLIINAYIHQIMHAAMLGMTWKIYEKFSAKSTKMIVVTMLSLGFLTPIFLFSIRNNELMEAKATKDVTREPSITGA